MRVWCVHSKYTEQLHTFNTHTRAECISICGNRVALHSYMFEVIAFYRNNNMSLICLSSELVRKFKMLIVKHETKKEHLQQGMIFTFTLLGESLSKPYEVRKLLFCASVFDEFNCPKRKNL